jgi:hypothetical protein
MVKALRRGPDVKNAISDRGGVVVAVSSSELFERDVA